MRRVSVTPLTDEQTGARRGHGPGGGHTAGRRHSHLNPVPRLCGPCAGLCTTTRTISQCFRGNPHLPVSLLTHSVDSCPGLDFPVAIVPGQYCHHLNFLGPGFEDDRRLKLKSYVFQRQIQALQRFVEETILNRRLFCQSLCKPRMGCFIHSLIFLCSLRVTVV